VLAAIDEAVMQLQEQGVALLPGWFGMDTLARLREAAVDCFDAVEGDDSVAERVGFNRFSHSVPIAALGEFGCDREALVAPLVASGIEDLITQGMGSEWACDIAQSWVRKKFAPREAPAKHYRIQDWHQDGALGVRFPTDAALLHASPVAMAELLTVWIALDDCGVDSPGLEFVRGCQQALLHPTELDDVSVRRRFEDEDFWVPEMNFGDSMIFLNSVLHRTHVGPEMRSNRLSVEYRIFPA
jgi:Phytanoyl-CoA dioxygenase (PhyH)